MLLYSTTQRYYATVLLIKTTSSMTDKYLLEVGVPLYVSQNWQMNSQLASEKFCNIFRNAGKYRNCLFNNITQISVLSGTTLKTDKKLELK